MRKSISVHTQHTLRLQSGAEGRPGRCPCVEAAVAGAAAAAALSRGLGAPSAGPCGPGSSASRLTVAAAGAAVLAVSPPLRTYYLQ